MQDVATALNLNSQEMRKAFKMQLVKSDDAISGDERDMSKTQDMLSDAARCRDAKENYFSPGGSLGYTGAPGLHTPAQKQIPTENMACKGQGPVATLFS